MELKPDRLKLVREQLGISMAEASRRLNLSKIGYCRYEYGDRSPSPQTIEVIAKCFHTSVAYLTGESDNPNPDFIVISEDEAPELFSLIESIKDTDPETLKRILTFYNKIK